MAPPNCTIVLNDTGAFLDCPTPGLERPETRYDRTELSMRVAGLCGVALATLISGCGRSPDIGQCSGDYWARRPSWADDFYGSAHISTAEACVTSADCRTSLHFCVRNQCRAFCARRLDPSQPDSPGSSDCGPDETCRADTDGQLHQYAPGFCSDFKGPDTSSDYSRGLTGGACIPNAWTCPSS